MDAFPASIAPAYGQPSLLGPGGEPPKRAHLYVGNLSPRVTEYMLQEIFAVAGPVLGVKIIPDRSFQHGGINYGFVEYHEMRSAETALQTLNGRRIFDMEVRVNWAYQNTNAQKEDLTNHFHLFCGDLSPEVTDSVLQKAFSAFGSLSDARVMWDMNTGKSRGYGFLAFRDRTDAEQAINSMNGEYLGSRAIRVNWANQKNNQGGGGGGGGPPGGGMGGGGYGGGGNSYEAVLTQAPASNTTIYVGNLVPYVTQADLIPLFQGFGYIVEIRMQPDRGFAFVKLDSHENAANAIVNLTGTMVHGRGLKCSWGKDREGGGGGGGGGMGGGGMGMGMGMGGGGGPGGYGMYAPPPGGGGGAPAQPYGAAPAPAGANGAAPQDPAAAAAAMRQWEQQYGAQWQAYMQQQAMLGQGAGQPQGGAPPAGGAPAPAPAPQP